MNGAPMQQSPIKLVTPQSTPVKIPRTPLVVSNRKISIVEDLLSPNRPIQVSYITFIFGLAV